jgi:exodeoxyribonuclease V alpha subunit
VQRLTLLHDPPPAELVIVDEISMLTMAQVHTILRIYGSEARLLFLGDDAQLPCIGRGAPVRDLQRCVPTLRLTQCMRTEGAGLLHAAATVRDHGTLGEAEAVAGEVEVMPMEDDEAVAAAAAFATAVPPWDPSYVQIITPQNKHRDLVNAAVQARTTNVGEDARTFSGCYEGDAVRFDANTDKYKNGTEGVLVHVTEKRGRGDTVKTSGRVRLQDDHCVDVEGVKHLLPAYAGTVHKAQGSEYGHVVLALFRNSNHRMITRELVYTSITRARRRLTVVGYTDALALLASTARRTVMPHL